ncbi:MAG: DUF1674 domain-containing protein [Alphaproteobacteria bacterium]|nr:DUF1674 domain-containing protein [Alphaproteobacteria bacterium]
MTQPAQQKPPAQAQPVKKAKPAPLPPATEQGGPPGPEPTRYGDWERRGKCVDF